MVQCSFSGKEIPQGRGIMYIRKDGRVWYFADRKAEKNMVKLGRKPRETKWTKEYHKIKETTKKQ
ncbi:MAG: 50S ribosomal protein L24e [Candidatus Woesearchaeota archaeon]